MNIDKLPDDCLLYIFNLFNRFDTLLNCSEVCERWKVLVLKRLSNVQYLTDYDTKYMVVFPAGNTIIFKDNELQRIEVSKWFPKLRIFDSVEDTDVNFIANLTVKGMFLSYRENFEKMTFHNPSLSMLAISKFCSFFANEIQGPMLKQLFVGECNVSVFARYAKYFPNLKRLHIEPYLVTPEQEDFYAGPFLEKLEILEICYGPKWELGQYCGFSLADHCPALKSAFHHMQTSRFPINRSIKNHFLEDLVLQCGYFPPEWPVLKLILSKYPNLKHLSIRGAEISDENIPELLELLPRIILIDIIYSTKVTEKSAEYIEQYCSHNKHWISFYYQDDRTEITKKWSHLSTEFVLYVRGFDFMKHCFLKESGTLPGLLDPVE